MITATDELKTIVSQFLNGQLTTAVVENWVAQHSDEQFDNRHQELFATLEAGLMELGSGALSEGDLRGQLRKTLSQIVTSDIRTEHADSTGPAVVSVSTLVSTSSSNVAVSTARTLGLSTART